MKTVIAMVCAILLGSLCFAQDGGNPKKSELMKKLDSIIIPEVQFREANVSDVVLFLSMSAKKYDTDKAGVNIVLMDTWNKTKVTIVLHKVSLRKALRLVAEMSDLSINVEDEVIVLRKLKHEEKK